MHICRAGALLGKKFHPKTTEKSAVTLQNNITV
jgi:hypothetical protein